MKIVYDYNTLIQMGAKDRHQSYKNCLKSKKV
jgi:hypothetical protein